MPSSTTILVLLVVAVVFAVSTWLFGRVRLQGWAERKMPGLFPEVMARSWEAIASARPFNFVAIYFLLILGGFAVIEDFRGVPFEPAFRYGIAIMVAAYALYFNRRNAKRRGV